MNNAATEPKFRPLSVAIMTVSDSRNEDTDTSGQLLIERVESAGHRLGGRRIEPDDIYRIRAAVSAWIAV
ncbi:uncharacterized protein METZ01_LOCUS318840, partial [marine metagenome]